MTGDLGGGNWNGPDQIRAVARYGLNWAIPILAFALDDTKLTTRYKDGITFIAVEKLQEITGGNFGYHPDASKRDKQAAVNRALNWWRRGGKISMARRISEDHPLVIDSGDLLLNGEQLEAQLAGINDENRQTRRLAVAGLGTVLTYQTQRALLNALEKEPLSSERVRILTVLKQQPKLWHLRDLIARLQIDDTEEVRLLAATCIADIMRDKSSMIWNLRMESREAALQLARHLAVDPSTSPAIRGVSIDILLAWGSYIDLPLLRKLAGESNFIGHMPLQAQIAHVDKWLWETPNPKIPMD